MLYNAIYFFFAGAVLTRTFSLDYISAVLFFFVFVFLYQTFSKTYLHDNLKDTKFSKENFVSFILYFVFFIFSVFLVNINQRQIHPFALDRNNVEFIGKVVSLEKGLDKQNVTVRVVANAGKAVETQHETESINPNEQGGDFAKQNHPLVVPSNKNIYVNFQTNVFQNFELYEMLEIKGYTEVTVKKSVSLKHPLFYYYETEKLLYDISFKLNSYDLETRKLQYETNILEKIIKYIKDFSQKIKDIIRHDVNEPYATIASGVTLGDTGSFTQEVKLTFVNSGLIHLMVLSGTNVTILIFSIWILFKNISIKRRTFLTLLIVWIFIFMTGLNPPATRAAIMGSFVLIGNVLGRKINLIHLLIISLFILALIDINSLFYNPSLHLSFLATFALFIMTPEIYKILNSMQKRYLSKKFSGVENESEKKILNISKNIKIFFSVSLSIFLTTTPYILAMVGKFGTGGLLLTFISEPITFIIMFSSFLLIISNILLPEFLSNLTDLVFVNLTEIFSNIFYALAKLGAEYFPTIDFSLSKNFVIIYFAIVIFLFIFLNQKTQNKNDIILKL